MWGNRHIAAPDDIETLSDGRTLWSCTVLDRTFEGEITRHNAPVMPLGSGWWNCWSPVLEPVRRWSPERKGAARRRNLDRRMRKQMPLFAEGLIEAELACRPDYFYPAPVADEADSLRA